MDLFIVSALQRLLIASLEGGISIDCGVGGEGDDVGV